MSILKYFHKTIGKDQEDSIERKLPDPDGNLSKSIPSKAIRAANESIEQLLELKSKGVRKTPYLVLTPAQRFAVGKRAAEHGVMATIRYYAKRFPNLALKETTVRRIKNVYLSELKKGSFEVSHSGESSDSEVVQQLPPKKKGRPLLIGEDLDRQVRDYLQVLRKNGAPVNTAIVIACGDGIVRSKDANLLAINGGSITLSKDWAKYILKRMGWVKRRASSKAKVMVENFGQVKEDFLLDVKNIVLMDEIPGELIINWDQTGVNYIPVSSWTMQSEGAKKVEIIAKDDKRQITIVLAGSLKGDVLPLQVIYQGKTPRCLPSVKFPSNWHITFSENHWSNEDTMHDYVMKIILPYVQQKRESLKLAPEYPAVVLFDNFSGQCTEKILKLLDANNINCAIIPANCTDQLQPMDLSVNKCVKDYLRTQFQEWYAKEIIAQSTSPSEMVPVDLRLSIVKPLSAKWIIKTYDYLKSNTQIISNGFRAAGIASCLNDS